MKLDSFFSPKNKLRGSHLQHNTRHAKTFVAKSLSSFGQRRDQGKETLHCFGGVMKKTGGRFIKTASYFERKTHTHTHIQVGEHANFFTQKCLWVRKPAKNGFVPGFFYVSFKGRIFDNRFSPATWGVVKKDPKGAKSKGSALGQACLGFTGWHHYV